MNSPKFAQEFPVNITLNYVQCLLPKITIHKIKLANLKLTPIVATKLGLSTHFINKVMYLAVAITSQLVIKLIFCFYTASVSYQLTGRNSNLTFLAVKIPYRTQ